MNAINKGYSLRITLQVVMLMVSMAGMLRVSQAAQFTPPDLEGFNLHDEREGDGDGDGNNETRIGQYLNANGDSIVSFSSNKQVWAWSLNTRDSDLGPKNYVIRDSDCDGIFDEVYGLDDEFQVPDCVK